MAKFQLPNEKAVGRRPSRGGDFRAGEECDRFGPEIVGGAFHFMPQLARIGPAEIERRSNRAGGLEDCAQEAKN